VHIYCGLFIIYCGLFIIYFGLFLMYFGLFRLLVIRLIVKQETIIKECSFCF
jgi:hypothetical protein